MRGYGRRPRRHIFQACVTAGLALIVATAVFAASPPPSDVTFRVMRQALRHALDVRFTQALETTAELSADQHPDLAFRLTQGIIAYFQAHWQSRGAAEARRSGHQNLQKALKRGAKQLQADPEAAHVRLFVGLAAVFDALLVQEDDTWQSAQLFAQGEAWLKESLIRYEALTDAHLGLGLLYFARSPLPPLLRGLGKRLSTRSAHDALHHLKRAAESARFSADVARTFLARTYELEGQYDEAIALGQTLQEAFPTNGYYALLTGRSQCAARRFAACAQTLKRLADRLEAADAVLERPDDRFDLYYFLGLASNETAQYDEAFRAFRRAINYDLGAHKDETLWAKYHLATLYERRGRMKTARQIYRRLLRDRNVEDLHERIQQRLARLP